ncbi:lytic transglycosylase domain-containing protein [Promicromonospora citrea]|uniref:Transglycosylase SLT domain-containing protein n=2 Tax=Promicromonospora citrea TaxID=43677 RepID=A0A8H9GLP1_9MICO|nr:lytic murein transglycosylase [Promicromonospora citrea]GGM38360.1 hypothetical protein GCM10010102_37400 [Promicromonospora citrea]
MRGTARAAVLAAALVLTGCAAAERGAPSGPLAELGPPTAPRHDLPVAAVDPADADAVPVAELPDPAWLRETAERTGIPRRALAAYAGAALRTSWTEPGCGLGWNALAGIGAVESVHGSYLGARAGADGIVHPPIIGIPLDGSDGVMEILDTDGGELDGDDRFDRAVGPLQFIPTTWGRHARDGDLDGRTDPHQIDDAALTAAGYLCSAGGDVTTDEGWADALTTYNRSLSYAHDVTDLAVSYIG